MKSDLKTTIEYGSVNQGTGSRRFIAVLSVLLSAITLGVPQAACGATPTKGVMHSEPTDPDPPSAAVWKDIQPGIHSGFGSMDVADSKSLPPAGQPAASVKLHGWKGERVNCKLLVWSAGVDENISINATGLAAGDHEINRNRISISVVKYVLTDGFPGGNERKDKSAFPVHLMPDRLSRTNSFAMDAPGTRPVWISVDIPPETPAGTYHGMISRQSASGTASHRISLEVQNVTLPPPCEWSFHLDLWQHPDAVARYGRVKLWSPEHLSLLRPMLTMLAQAGQKCITTTLIDEPWNHQTYDDFGSMIKWTKRANGTWTYDYSHFDTYVALAMECGITKQINCYSMVPVENKISWFDEKSGQFITAKPLPGTVEYEEIWRNFLTDFEAHLKNKGWLDKTTIALDERDEEEMKRLFGFLRKTAPELKISMAGFYFKNLNPAIYDFSANWHSIDQISGDVMAARKKSDLNTTFYVACNIPKPNTFTFSPPPESCYEGWFASALGFDGFLRWAYNSWVENPELDSRFVRWPSGDAFLVYPDAQSSVRFERIREGIQDYEKIRILRDKLANDSSKEAAAAGRDFDSFLKSIDTKTLATRSAADVVNEGKELLYEIVKSLGKNPSQQ